MEIDSSNFFKSVDVHVTPVPEFSLTFGSIIVLCYKKRTNFLKTVQKTVDKTANSNCSLLNFTTAPVCLFFVNAHLLN